MKNWFIEHKKAILLSSVGTLLPMVIGMILWNRLPDSIVTHWGGGGAPDGVSGKAFAVFCLPAVMAVLNLVALAITAADPKQKGQTKKALGLVFWIMPMISLAVTGVMYAVALGRTVNVVMIVPLLLGTMFVFLGNYMPKVKQNSTLGIKISWTLHNEENWNKTHRFAGKCWVIGGLLMLVTAVVPLAWMMPVMTLALIPLIVAPVAYSYSIYRKHKALGIRYEIPAVTGRQKGIRILMIVVLVLLVAVLAVVMFTGSIGYTCGEDALEIEASFAEDLVIDYERMDSVELLEAFDMGARNMGVGSVRLSMGAFRNEQLGDYTLYAYNSCDAMIIIRSGDEYLAINAETPEQTRELYLSLREKRGE